MINSIRARLFPLGAGDGTQEACCPLCHGPAVEFRDLLSETEFKISGLCQTCQDEIFGSSAEDVL